MPGKRQFLKTIHQDEQPPKNIFRAIDYTSRYIDRYYNIFMTSGDWEGSALSEQSTYYLMQAFWLKGKVASWKIRFTDEAGFADFAPTNWNMWNQPASIKLINERKVPIQLVPSKEMVVDKDCVIGYAQMNHKPVYSIVSDYAKQLSDIDNCININMQTQKMPFVILGDDDETINRLVDMLRRIMGNDLALVVNARDKNAVQILNTNAPFIIDKLYEYRTQIENELKSALGLENSGGFEKKERMISDEVNSQKASVQNTERAFTKCMENFAKKMREVLGLDVRYTSRYRDFEEEEKKEDPKDAMPTDK